MLGKFRLVSVLLIAMLIVVAGCSMLMRNANAQIFLLTLQSREDNGATTNKGQIVLTGMLQ